MDTKVCGLREPENIRQIVDLGADYIGLIFYPKSPRYVGDRKELATWLTEQEGLFANTKKVGVFVNAEMDEILNTVHDYRLDFVQLHGDESAGYCRELKLLWSVSTLRSAAIIKAFRIDEQFDFAETAPYTDSCALFVFDTGGRKEHGGTGEQWDWERLQEYQGPTPFLLSGGIGPEDALAVSRLDHPQLAGVDLNSRFELAPGEKNISTLGKFFGHLG